MVLKKAGAYEVSEETRADWCAKTPVTVNVDVISGKATPSYIEFGNFKCVEITLFKYDDVNSNGVYDDGDSPIPDWVFYLRN